jgi:DnaJ-class molecular chaperone
MKKSNEKSICGKCSGTGAIPVKVPKECSTCGGSGTVLDSRCQTCRGSGTMYIFEEIICTRCKGSGQV